MGLSSLLDQLAQPDRSAAERFREALDLFEEGVEMQRRNLKRHFPDASAAELHQKLLCWLARQDEP